jgi:hypothetical protein
MKRGKGYRLLSETPAKTKYEETKPKNPKIQITKEKIKTWLNTP